MPVIDGSIDHQAVWACVRRQHNAISRIQLLDFGFSRHAIQHRIDRGRLAPEWPGVYRVGRRQLDRVGRFMAAILACGEGAILSHESAANVWGIRKGGLDPIDVSVPHARRIRLKGIRVHRRNPMPAATTKQNLPLCRPLFTLIDLAATLDTDPLEATINEADRLDLIDPETLGFALDQVPLFPGVGILRETLARYSRTDSNLERRFLAIARKAGIPPPVTQVHKGRGRIDFHWPDLGLVVETDGLTYHRTPMQQLEDRRRDQAHTVAGRTQMRFANLQIREEPNEVATALKRVVDRLRQQL